MTNDAIITVQAFIDKRIDIGEMILCLCQLYKDGVISKVEIEDANYLLINHSDLFQWTGTIKDYTDTSR